MQACEEATQLIMSLTAQVASLKQMTSAEQISRHQIISTGEDILQAWLKGEKHNQILHARWKEATDPKVMEKKFKQISKEYEAKLAEVEKAKAVLKQHEADQADPKMPTVREPVGPQEVPTDIPAIEQPKKGKGK
jgi:hypothetical protein